MTDRMIKNLSEYLERFVENEIERGNSLSPGAVSFYMRNVACVVDIEKDSSVDDDFITKFEEFIKSEFQKSPANESVKYEVHPSRKRTEFVEGYTKLKRLRVAYLDVLQETSQVLEYILEIKEEFAEYMKSCSEREVNKCDLQEIKLDCMKLQFLRQLYTDMPQTAHAHVILHQMLLKQKLESELKLEKLVEDKHEYDRLKGNEEYLKIQDIHQKLLMQKKKLDYLY